MAGDDLTVVLFLVGLAITLGLTEITVAGWKHKVLIGGLLITAALCLGAGIGWPWLKGITSSKIQFIVFDIAQSPVSWFVVAMTAINAGMRSPQFDLKKRATIVTRKRPLSDEAPAFREDLGHPIDNEWWANVGRVANEARVRNIETAFGRFIRHLPIWQQTGIYASKVNDLVQLWGCANGPMPSEKILAKGDQIKFRPNSHQMDAVDSADRPFYRYIHFRAVQEAEVATKIDGMAALYVSPSGSQSPSSGGNVTIGPGVYRAGDGGLRGDGGDLIIRGGDAR